VDWTKITRLGERPCHLISRWARQLTVDQRTTANLHKVDSKVVDGLVTALDIADKVANKVLNDVVGVVKRIGSLAGS
jgi:hypothetical protein